MTPRHLRIGILVIVAALCVVPPLVRAVYSGGGTTPIRLNRGFERPPAKSSIQPAQAQAISPVPHVQTPVERVRVRRPAADVPLPSTSPDRAPDEQRGPPSAFPPAI